MEGKAIAIIGGGVAVAFLIMSRNKGINMLSPSNAQQLAAQRARIAAAQNPLSTTGGQAATIAASAASIFGSLFKAFGSGGSQQTAQSTVPVASFDPTQPVYGVGSDAVVGGQLTPPPIGEVAQPTDSSLNDVLSSYQSSDPTLAAPDTTYPDTGFSTSDPSALTDTSFNSDPLSGLGYA
jgi:hypothetical protein